MLVKMRYIQTMTIVAVVFEISALNYARFCKICRCKPLKRKATCSHLTYIPEIPVFVNSLILKENRFNNVTRQFLIGQHRKNLTSLSLIKNSIRRLYPDAFGELVALKQLTISMEYYLDINELKNALNGPMSLKKIILQDNNWTNIPIDMFDSPATRKVNWISLSKNKIRNISFDVFAHILVPFKIDLSKNKLVTFTINKSVNVRTLDLQHNDIVELPNFCSERQFSKFEHIETIFLSGNALSFMSSTSFECLFSLKHLYLDSNRFQELQNNTFSGMSQLTTLSIEHNTQLLKINSFAFNSSSLQKLNFGYNNFHFNWLKKHDQRFDTINIFRNSPNLQVLDLTMNFLPNSDIILKEMFSPLRSLTTLNLHFTRLYDVPRNVFPYLPLLEKVILKGNYIHSWEDEIFDNLTNLENLNIEANNIRLINKSSIPFDKLPQLKTLDLSNNPFSCTCDLMWFTNWIRDINKPKLEIKNFPHRYKCMFPEDMRGKLLIEYFPTEESCTPWNPLFTMAIIISSFGFLVLVLIFAVYHCHTNLRNYLYLLRIHQYKRKGYLRLNSSDDYEYHGFVVYCDADREWVHNDLLQRLENESLKLCVHHRDFDVGTDITENIDTYMKKCWKVVVVMSNAFAKSEWCQWEVDLIQERRRRQGKEAMILIMLKTITADHMTSPLRTLLSTTPYLTYRETIGEELFWQAVIEGLRRPLNLPPMAV